MPGRGPTRSSRNLSTSSGYTSGSQYSYDSEYMTNTDLSDSDADHPGYTQTIIKSKAYGYPAGRGPYNYQRQQPQKKSGCCKKFFKFLLSLTAVALVGYFVLFFLISAGVIDPAHPVAKFVGDVENGVMACLKNTFEQCTRETSVGEKVTSMVESAKKGDFLATKTVATDLAHDAADTVNEAKDNVMPKLVDAHGQYEEYTKDKKFADCCCSLCILAIPICACIGCYNAIMYCVGCCRTPAEEVPLQKTS